ncbi:MAG: aquaporin family protein [Planctomycetota bacterium]|nr:aquaporin family protein [Planctomycetota bacterium]MDG1983523.1 aquaporin family protein [Planctomycetota bacterium]
MTQRALLAEFVGTAGLLAGVVGSGIMAERLSPDDVGLQLLQNAIATAAVLVALILALQPASGAHFNPAVTFAARLSGELTTRAAFAYTAAQVAGGLLGVSLANLMFELPAIELSTKVRAGSHLLLAEFLATLGLVGVIHGVVRSGRAHLAAYAVGAYIAGAYYFTSSTSFANPAVTIARALTDTFAGIAPANAPAFIVVQLAAAAAAVPLLKRIYPETDG